MRQGKGGEVSKTNLRFSRTGGKDFSLKDRKGSDERGKNRVRHEIGRHLGHQRGERLVGARDGTYREYTTILSEWTNRLAQLR